MITWPSSNAGAGHIGFGGADRVYRVPKDRRPQHSVPMEKRRMNRKEMLALAESFQRGAAEQLARSLAKGPPNATVSEQHCD
jgi:hypothetical protein